MLRRREPVDWGQIVTVVQHVSGDTEKSNANECDSGNNEAILDLVRSERVIVRVPTKDSPDWATPVHVQDRNVDQEPRDEYERNHEVSTEESGQRRSSHVIPTPHVL
jgi:hypothetical protein